jgi:hypothetical protein
MFHLLQRLLSALHVPSQVEIEEAYLAEAVDVYDLERRMRHVDQQRACSSRIWELAHHA